MQIATGPTPTVLLGVGTHTIRLTVTDPANATGFDEVTVAVTSGTTVTYVGPNLLQSQGSNVLQASVTGPNGPIAGAQIAFTVNGTPFAATSNGAGIASVDVGAVAGSAAVIQIDYPAGAVRRCDADSDEDRQSVADRLPKCTLAGLCRIERARPQWR